MRRLTSGNAIDLKIEKIFNTDTDIILVNRKSEKIKRFREKKF